jgi:NAD(P)-dependent dehydrogenase (short-subunit alcohol dehydrogenase family)
MKIAIVTGGSRGLGRNAAVSLGRRGHGVILTYVRSKKEADEAVAEIEGSGAKAAALPLDASKFASFDSFAGSVAQTLKEKFGCERFDFLVNNAGIGLNVPFAQTTEAQFDELMNVHFKGVFFLTQKLLPLMNDGGRIINLSSGLARFSIPGYSAYASMKGAIEVLTRYLAKELGGRGIAVNTVAPGAIETDFGGGHLRDNRKLNEMIASQTALGRLGLPDDIGGLIAALCSEDCRWVNAQRIEASGGQSI